MLLEKVSFENCIIFALVLAEVTPWTIDLPEVRKHFFEQNEKQNQYEDFKYKNGGDSEGQVLYNNIEGNSKHNSKHYHDVYENTEYAREYGYESYMEKKVHGIVYNGSMYLEGLRRSLENYTRFLESCNRNNSRNETSSRNSTTWRPPVEFPLNSTDRENATNSMGDFANSTNSRCKEATRDSEHVRRLSELAMWATRELQDIAYARKYKKGDYHEMTMEENELILKLAWFLDRLAHYTGYEPEPKDFVDNGDERPTTSTNTPAPASLMTASEEVKRDMMECLSMNSSQPADERCRYPEPLPPLVRTMMEINSNISGIPMMPTLSSSTNRNNQVMPLTSESRQSPVAEQSMELLVASDYRPPYSNFPPILTAIRNVKKRSVSSMPEPEVLESAPFKSSTEDDQAINFLKYYAKHKVWEGSNLKNVVTKSKFEEYEVKNHLATHNVQKRAIDQKSKRQRLPENPFQDLSKYVKHKPGVNYIKDEAQVDKIKAAVVKIENMKTSPKYLIRKLTKMLRQKRSITFEKDIDLPRESGDPQRDISYYTKNKPGRNNNNDLVQQLQVRAGLEQIFNTGNIEVVRRFGANYNPLIPAPFYAGVLKSQADF